MINTWRGKETILCYLHFTWASGNRYKSRLKKQRSKIILFILCTPHEKHANIKDDDQSGIAKADTSKQSPCGKSKAQHVS